MLSVSQLTKVQSGQLLYSEGAFQIKPGEKVGLVGPNGAGKTTLFRMILGEEKADSGTISTPQTWRLSYFSQNVGEMAGKTALQEVMTGDKDLASLKETIDRIQQELETAYLDPESPPSDEWLEKKLHDLGEAQTSFERRGGFEIETKAQEILTGLGILPEDHSKMTEQFSGGWKMRIALAKVLVTRPDLILMDEPTNYLDLETIQWLEGWLKQFSGAIFMTSHDRVFMNAIVNKIVEVSYQKITTYSGNYDYYEQEKKLRQDQLLAQHDRQQAMLKKEEEFIAKFAARASHAAQVQSRVKKLEKIDRVEIPPEEQEIAFEFAKSLRGGNDVVSIENLCKIYKKPSGEDHLVFKDLSSTVRRLEKIAVVGVNGAGKSTLLKIIAGDIEATTGKAQMGAGIQVGYFSQYSLEVLNPEKTLWDEVKDRVPQMSDGAVRNLLAAFLFRGDDVEKKVRHLSGGEKSRLVLATILATPKNLLLLDEPTNHLDIKSREILLQALQNFEGTIMLVSHDRHFLTGLCNKVWLVSQGKINQYPGTYREWLQNR
jgi:ATP-binding cassette subfamily F protein 3